MVNIYNSTCVFSTCVCVCVCVRVCVCVCVCVQWRIRELVKWGGPPWAQDFEKKMFLGQFQDLVKGVNPLAMKAWRQLVGAMIFWWSRGQGVGPWKYLWQDSHRICSWMVQPIMSLVSVRGMLCHRLRHATKALSCCVHFLSQHGVSVDGSRSRTRNICFPTRSCRNFVTKKGNLTSWILVVSPASPV